jgi:uncharacterized membrane protein
MREVRIDKTWWQALMIILLALGIFFRFVNLDRKVYWGDEVFTSFRLSGYTVAELKQQIGNGRVVSIEDFQRYQYPSPEKNAADTVKSLALEDSQHVPLYYVMTRFWVQWFGNSVTATRSFSAVISLLVFPCLYWLCKELFESLVITWVAIALIAVSPFQVLYAQEARPYSLWIVMIFLSSAALLRAMRVKTKASWGIYGLTVALGLYTHVFFTLVAIGHGLYLTIIERFRLSKTLTSYLLSSLIGILAFVPWIWVIINAPSQFDAQSWMNTKSSFVSICIRWAGIVSRAFLDLGVGPDDSFKRLIPLIPLILLVLALIAYSLYFLYRHAPQRVWLFVFTLTGITALAFMLPDFVLGRRYGTSRFITPCILGIQLSLAYLLATKITSPLISNQQQKLWRLITVVLISIGVLSCTLSSQAQMWWNKLPDINKHYPQIAKIINQTPQPLLITDAPPIHLGTLSYLLDSKVQLQLVTDTNIPDIPKNFSDVFLFSTSDSLRIGIEKEYNSKTKQIYEQLWKLELR